MRESCVQMNMNGKTEKRTEIDLRERFSGKSVSFYVCQEALKIIEKGQHKSNQEVTIEFNPAKFGLREFNSAREMLSGDDRIMSGCMRKKTAADCRLNLAVPAYPTACLTLTCTS